ncbi:MAG: HD domain-containing phosphohydrolase [Pseudomonadota bacterium]
MAEEKKAPERIDLGKAGFARSSASFNPLDLGMSVFPLDSFFADEPSPVDIYLPFLDDKSGGEIEMRVAVVTGEAFKEAWRQRLLSAGHRNVYVREGDVEFLKEYFGRNAKKVLDDPNAPSRRKAMALTDVASLFLKISFQSELSPRSLGNAVDMVHKLVNNLCSDTSLLSNLSSVLKYDHTVYAHSVNVCMISMSFGLYLGWPTSRLKTLGVGGMLHDIGMSRLPPGLLQKKGAFMADEREIMQRHPRLGYEALLSVGQVSFDVLTVIQHHHECNDGAGYPQGLKAEQIPEVAQVVHLVDVYDGMTGTRQYKSGKSPLEAVTEMLMGCRSQFNAYLLQRFVRYLASPAFKGA